MTSMCNNQTNVNAVLYFINLRAKNINVSTTRPIKEIHLCAVFCVKATKMMSLKIVVAQRLVVNFVVKIVKYRFLTKIVVEYFY